MHGTINKQEQQVRKILYKTLLKFDKHMKQQNETRYKEKIKKEIFLYQTTNFLKIWFLFLVHRKGRKKGKY